MLQSAEVMKTYSIVQEKYSYIVVICVCHLLGNKVWLKKGKIANNNITWNLFIDWNFSIVINLCNSLYA